MNALLARLTTALRGIDPKALQVVITGALTGLIAKVGLDIDDPTVLLALGTLTTFLVGVIVPNAATGQRDRWKGDRAREPDAIVP